MNEKEDSLMKINDELIENLLKDKSGLHQKYENLTKTLVENIKIQIHLKNKKKLESFFDDYISNGRITIIIRKSLIL